MNDSYPVILNRETRGTVYVKQEGLYYRFICQAKQSDDRIYRLKLQAVASGLDLGICVIENGRYILEKRIPMKNVPEDILHFELFCNDSKERFIPVEQDKPFGNIKDLRHGKFARNDGIPGIVLADQS